MKKSLLEKLEEKQKKLKLEIREAKRKEAKLFSEGHKKRCEIIGEAFIKEMKNNEEIKVTVDEIIRKHIKTDKNKKILGI